MSTIEARKKAEKKYHDSVKHISIALKKDSEKYNIITDIAINENCSTSKIINAMIDYCIINDIDITAYLK